MFILLLKIISLMFHLNIRFDNLALGEEYLFRYPNSRCKQYNYVHYSRFIHFRKDLLARECFSAEDETSNAGYDVFLL